MVLPVRIQPNSHGRDATEPSSLRYAVDESPPHLLAAGLGFQNVLVIIAGIVLTPIVVLRAAEADALSTSWMIFAALLVSGVTTMVQARPLGRVGAGYVLFMGTSGAFIAVSITAVVDGGVPLLMTLVVISSLVQFTFAGWLSMLRRIITPTVGGTVIMLIAVSVFPIAFDMLSQVPDSVDPLAAPAAAAITFGGIIAIAIFGGRVMGLWAPIVGVVLGCVVAGGFGLVDVSRVLAQPWVGLPQGSWPGFDLSFDTRFWALLPAFIIVTLVGAIETYGDGIAIQRVSHRGEQPVDFRSVQGAVYADGLGNLLSGVMGTLPNTTYSTSISVVEITGVAARRVGLYGGAFLVLLAFSPKIAGLLLVVPNPVAGAYIALLLVLLFVHGIRLVAEEGLSYENGLVVGVAFWLGMGFQHRVVFQEQLPDWARTLLNNGMTAGGLLAVVLTVLLAARHRPRNKLSVELTVSTIRRVHEFISRFASRLGWDRSAVGRLELVTEEALLYLMSRQGSTPSTPNTTVHLSVRDEADVVELEIIAAPQGANLERLLKLLKTDGSSVEDDLPLRLIRDLAVEVKHQQFHNLDCLLIKVDSRPLGRATGDTEPLPASPVPS